MVTERRRKLFFADDEDVESGRVTDIYFLRTSEILKALGITHRHVAAEIHAYSLPSGYEWAVLVGVKEVARLLEGKPVDVYSMREGEVFLPMEPVMRIEGNYPEFGIYESAILGILRHESSVATRASQIKFHALEKPVIFFGIRCVHPSVAPAVDRAAYIGGCDAVSGVLGAEMIGERPVGTMPHALIIVIGDQKSAWRAFDQVMPPDVLRIALCDTWSDERQEALMAAEALKERLHGVRLDTPSSRRGNMRMIVEEVRWALRLNGYDHVKIYVSGGIDVEEVKELADVVDGFGIGTSIAFPRSVDLAMDVVEVEGRPVSKKGKLPGRKQVYRCRNFHDVVTSLDRKIDSCPRCGEGVKPLLHPVLVKGRLVGELDDEKVARRRVVERLFQIKGLGALDRPVLMP